MKYIKTYENKIENKIIKKYWIIPTKPIEFKLSLKKVGCPDNIINELSELAFDRFYQYHRDKCFLYFKDINLDKPKYSKFTGAVNTKSTWGIIDRYDGRQLVENGYTNQGIINIKTELLAHKYNL